MGRTKRDTNIVVTEIGNNEIIHHDLALADQRSAQLQKIVAAFGDGAPYDYFRVMSEARFLRDQLATACIGVGKRLILIKEHEEFGRFGAAVTALGFAPQAASRLMLIAAKFADKERLASLGKTKMLELAVLDDSDLHLLEKGGTIAGLTFEKCDKMSIADMKATLKLERDRNATKDETIANLHAEQDKDRLERNKKQPWDVKAKKGQTAIMGVSVFLTENILAYLATLASLADDLDKDAPPDQRDAVARTVIDEGNKVYSAIAEVQVLVQRRFQDMIVGVQYIDPKTK